MTGRSTRSPRRRTVVAMFVVLAVIGAFVIRLVDIQVVNAKEHIEQSLELGLSSSQETYGTRGAIVDENGATLAGSIVLDFQYVRLRADLEIAGLLGLRNFCI